MSNYDSELPGCFGMSDLIFAGHPADEDRAFEWLKLLRAKSIGLGQAADQIKAFLQAQGASTSHITDQVKEASRYLKPWLLD